jgi:hypothetical protein
VRPPRPATGVPDLLFAVATALIVMAIVFVIASFAGGAVVSDSVGRALARLFAATLLISGALLFGMGFVLLREERFVGDHYWVPLGVGTAVGLVESAFFLRPNGPWLFAPLLLFVFALRPVRRLMARRLAGGRR